MFLIVLHKEGSNVAFKRQQHFNFRNKKRDFKRSEDASPPATRPRPFRTTILHSGSELIVISGYCLYDHKVLGHKTLNMYYTCSVVKESLRVLGVLTLISLSSIICYTDRSGFRLIGLYLVQVCRFLVSISLSRFILVVQGQLHYSSTSQMVIVVIFLRICIVLKTPFILQSNKFQYILSDAKTPWTA